MAFEFCKVAAGAFCEVCLEGECGMELCLRASGFLE
jgi:hypothetical protein